MFGADLINPGQIELSRRERKHLDSLFRSGTWSSDLALGGNTIEYYANGVDSCSVDLLQDILEESGFNVGHGDFYFQPLLTKEFGSITCYAEVLPHTSNRGRATLSFGFDFKDVDEKTKGKIYKRFLENLKKKGETVYLPVGGMVTECLKQGEKEKIFMKNRLSTKKRLDFIKTIREDVMFKDEKLDCLKGCYRFYHRAHYTSGETFLVLDDDVQIFVSVSYKGKFKKRDIGKIKTYCEQQFGNPARILLTPPEKIGIVKDNNVLVDHRDVFNDYTNSTKEQILYLDVINKGTIVYTILTGEPYLNKFEGGTFFDRSENHGKTRLESRVLNYFKKDLCKEIPFNKKIRIFEEPKPVNPELRIWEEVYPEAARYRRNEILRRLKEK